MGAAVRSLGDSVSRKSHRTAIPTVDYGSGMLLLVIEPGIICGLVLPILGETTMVALQRVAEDETRVLYEPFPAGALPDAATVLFSGLGPDPQVQINVGMGSLAGSSISAWMESPPCTLSWTPFSYRLVQCSSRCLGRLRRGSPASTWTMRRVRASDIRGGGHTRGWLSGAPARRHHVPQATQADEGVVPHTNGLRGDAGPAALRLGHAGDPHLLRRRRCEGGQWS